MPAFLLCFLLFCGWLFYERRKNNRIEEQKKSSFWERESHANTTRRQDTSDIDYILVDFDSLPFCENADGDEQRLQNKLLMLKDQQIADLSKYSNTELKLKYGRPNFDILSAADENYNILISTLAEWGCLLHKSGRDGDALIVLNSALSYGSAAAAVYTTLGVIYGSRREPGKITSLINEVTGKEILAKGTILSSLRESLGKCYSAEL